MNGRWMKRRLKVLFLQLPLLDNDITPAHENVPLAGGYLGHALAGSPESRFFTSLVQPASWEPLDDAHLLQRIIAARPDVIACTLYLWNIERTLNILKRARAIIPVRVIAGGPEIARDHPFLFRSTAVDVAVIGEGEPVFPSLLRAMRTGRRTDFQNVAWRNGWRWTWGSKLPPHLALDDMLPPPGWRGFGPDARGMAYLEATRGCPMNCTYCSYNQRRSRMTCLEPNRVEAHVRALIRAGTREIRFIDPTFNTHPFFEDILRRLAAVNRKRKAVFFAELRPDRVTVEQARMLAASGFAEIEVGVQSCDPQVLRLIQRPLSIAASDAGIRALAGVGIRVTLDLMYGLPRQPLSDIHRSVRWAANRKNVRVQCLQTLLLPGTEIRRARSRYGLQGMDRPPYAVTATARLSNKAMQQAEAFIERKLGCSYDGPTERFVGHRPSGLFPEQVHIDLDTAGHRMTGSENRRAVFFHSHDFFAVRHQLRDTVARAIRNEPYVLWQFVLVMGREEPLDVLDMLAAEVLKHLPLVLDHLPGVRFGHLRASRRIFVRLAGRRFARSWVIAAGELLRSHFF